MAELAFAVRDIRAEPYAVTPELRAVVEVEERTGETVHALALRVQVRIEPQRRRYDDEEERGLRDLFGGRERYADTLKPFLWLHASTVVPGFTTSTELGLTLPCTYDFDVAGTTYLRSLRDGEIPLVFLFSGTVFTRGTSGFTVTQVPWNAEATYRMPVSVWRSLMDSHFPGAEWLRLRRETVQALAGFKHERGLTGWDETVAALLVAASAGVGVHREP